MTNRDERLPFTSKPIGWWEDYSCGCTSETVRLKRELVGYCSQHGASRRKVWPEFQDDAPEARDD